MLPHARHMVAMALLLSAAVAAFLLTVDIDPAEQLAAQPLGGASARARPARGREDEGAVGGAELGGLRSRSKQNEGPSREAKPSRVRGGGTRLSGPAHDLEGRVGCAR